MANMFEQRERAAEGIYVRDEESRFLARRRGIEMLAAWAAESMALDDAGGRDYRHRLVDALLTGMPETDLLEAVQTDLERAGKPALSTHAATVFAQATEEATAALSGRPTSAAVSGRSGAPGDRFASRWGS